MSSSTVLARSLVNEMKDIGFTGTRVGMTLQQIHSVDVLLFRMTLETPDSWAHHGDCLGADAGFHRIARLNGLKVHGHPPDNPSNRAWCDFDSQEEEKPYLIRNKDIVDFSDSLIACPQGFEEELRSGTWSTIRYARQVGRQGVIVWPDGRMSDLLDEKSIE